MYRFVHELVQLVPFANLVSICFHSSPAIHFVSLHRTIILKFSMDIRLFYKLYCLCDRFWLV